MPNLFTKLILFASSYLPLWIIFAVQAYTRDSVIGMYVFLGLAGICLVGLLVFLRIVESLNPVPLKIAELRRRDGEAMSYIVTYLLPFIAMPSCKTGELLSLAIFLFVLGVLYVNSDMIHINPILNLMRWHVYEIEDGEGHIRTFLSRKRFRAGEEIEAAKVGEDLFVYTNRGKQA